MLGDKDQKQADQLANTSESNITKNKLIRTKIHLKITELKKKSEVLEVNFLPKQTIKIDTLKQTHGNPTPKCIKYTLF